MADSARHVPGRTGLGPAGAPLDPPTWREHWTLLDVLPYANRLVDSTTFSLVLLQPPEESAVCAWRAGTVLPRTVLLRTVLPRTLLAVTRTGTTTSEAVVDVPNRRLLSWRDAAGAQAPWLDPAYRLEGNQVEWGAWRFHVRPDQRVGPVVSLVRWVDDERERPILYEGSLSEIFVPYMDPSAGWYSATSSTPANTRPAA